MQTVSTMQNPATAALTSLEADSMNKHRPSKHSRRQQALDVAVGRLVRLPPA